LTPKKFQSFSKKNNSGYFLFLLCFQAFWSLCLVQYYFNFHTLQCNWKWLEHNSKTYSWFRKFTEECLFTCNRFVG